MNRRNIIKLLIIILGIFIIFFAFIFYKFFGSTRIDNTQLKEAEKDQSYLKMLEK